MLLHLNAVNTHFFFFFFFYLMATVNWLTILPLFGCAHKNLNILKHNKVKFIYILHMLWFIKSLILWNLKGILVFCKHIIPYLVFCESRKTFAVIVIFDFSEIKKNHYYTAAPRRGRGYTVLPLSVCRPSFRPSKIFFVTFFSVTVDGRNLIFGHKHHIGIPYCG